MPQGHLSGNLEKSLQPRLAKRLSYDKEEKEVENGKGRFNLLVGNTGIFKAKAVQAVKLLPTFSRVL
jgi:hypothetical protein